MCSSTFASVIVNLRQLNYKLQNYYCYSSKIYLKDDNTKYWRKKNRTFVFIIITDTVVASFDVWRQFRPVLFTIYVNSFLCTATSEVPMILESDFVTLLVIKIKFSHKYLAGLYLKKQKRYLNCI